MRTRPLFLALLCGLIHARSLCLAEEPSGLSKRLVGQEFQYTVHEGDSLASVGARFGVDSPLLAKHNGLSPRAGLRAGQILRIDNRHIVPAVLEDGILINIPQRLLFFFDLGSLVAWYPVGIGRADWKTPRGHFFVATKEEHPVWDVPPSIQEEMRRQGKRVEKRVPAGPRNPLGQYWMGLSPSSCGIHGTNAPSSVYRFQTHGCIRLHQADVADLFSRVSIGTPVEIVYRPILAVRLEDGREYVESHPDAYRKIKNSSKELVPLWISPGCRALARETIRRREGIATELPID